MANHTMFVVTILPTYNELDNIVPLIERLLASMPSSYMVLVVDDDSPDGTWQAVQELMTSVNPDSLDSSKPLPEATPRLALIRRVGEKGLTSAIQRGIDEAIDMYGADVVTWMDCDLSMPPEDVAQLVRAIAEGDADVAVGSRWIPGGADEAHGLMARSLSWIINHYAMLLLGNQVHDYTSGFIAVRREVLQRIPLQGDYGEYCIDLLGRAQKLGYRLVEVPYICVPRTAGASKTGANIWDYLVKGRKYVSAAWRVRREASERGNVETLER
jgi:dolichol-phosphate mannosyltransferase